MGCNVLYCCLLLACASAVFEGVSAGRMSWVLSTASSVNELTSEVIDSVTALAGKPASTSQRRLLAAPSPKPSQATKPKPKSNPPKRTISVVALSRSSLTIKPDCSYFLQEKPGAETCYDLENHQQRHNLVYVVSRQVYQRPTTSCTPLYCNIKGTPFGKPGHKLVAAKETLYTIDGPAAKPKTPSSVISRAQAVEMGKDAQLVLQNRAHAVLVGSRLTFKGAWLDILNATMTAIQTRISGQMNMLQVSAGQLKVINGHLPTTNTKAWIYGGSRLLLRNGTATFAIRGKTAKEAAADPSPFMCSDSTIELQQGKLAFINHPDVYFLNTYLRLNGSTFAANKSNVRFFDSVIDMRGSRFLASQSKVWLFNTTLVWDNKVVKVGGKFPVKLGTVLGSRSLKGAVASGSIQVTNL